MPTIQVDGADAKEIFRNLFCALIYAKVAMEEIEELQAGQPIEKETIFHIQGALHELCVNIEQAHAGFTQGEKTIWDTWASSTNAANYPGDM